jgi:hypothetical protein
MPFLAHLAKSFRIHPLCQPIFFVPLYWLAAAIWKKFSCPVREFFKAGMALSK